MSQKIGTFIPLNSIWSEEFGNDYFASGKILIDWLSHSGQNVWQMLPLQANTWHGNESYFFSPYSSYGVGLNPLFLYKDERDLNFPKASNEFMEENEFWINDYCVFLAISEKMGTDFWPDWPTDLQKWDSETVKNFSKDSSSRINYFKNQQAYLHKKFAELRSYAMEMKIELWGDLPFYLPINSPLVWKNRECFTIDNDGTFPFISGAQAGKHFDRQEWGHPLYRWGKGIDLEKVINFWKRRLKYISNLFDFVRLDSAIRFFTFAKLHVSSSDLDRICFGPGEKIFEPIVGYARQMGLEVFAEDISGFDMRVLHSSMKHLDVAGVSVFTMSLSETEDEFDQNHFNQDLFEENQIFYTSTHDTPTLLSYLENLPEWQKQIIIQKLCLEKSTDSREMVVNVRQKLLEKSQVLIVPMQDWIMSKRRINVPGTMSSDNWNYRMECPVEKLTAFHNMRVEYKHERNNQ